MRWRLLAALTGLCLAACSAADRSIGTAQATCERFRVVLAGAHSTLLSGLATDAGTAASELRAAGADPLPWSGLPAHAAVARCSFAALPIRLHEQDLNLFVDAVGRHGDVPLQDVIPGNDAGP